MKYSLGGKGHATSTKGSKEIEFGEQKHLVIWLKVIIETEVDFERKIEYIELKVLNFVVFIKCFDHGNSSWHCWKFGDKSISKVCSLAQKEKAFKYQVYEAERYKQFDEGINIWLS